MNRDHHALPAWTADDIGRTGPATMPVQYHPSEPAEAATERGAEPDTGDGLDAARGFVFAVLFTAGGALLGLLLSALWGAR